MTESWREIHGYPGYQVSSCGRVRLSDGRVTSGSDTGHGYRRLCFGAGAARRHEYVHRLVASAFLPNPLGLPEVNHIDANRANNRVENLEWVDHCGNMRHANALGLLTQPGLRGSDHPGAKLTDDQVREIYARYAAGGMTQYQLADEYGVCQNQIWLIVAGRAWTHITGGRPARGTVRKYRARRARLNE